MDIKLLDKSLEPIGILDRYESLIWNVKYCGFGDFEIYTSVVDEDLKTLTNAAYVSISESDRLMMVEEVVIVTHVEEGNFITVTGRSLEALLGRRVVWKVTTLDGPLDESVKRLIVENVINPEDTNRKIDRLIYEDAVDPSITDMVVDKQLTGTNLYDAVVHICENEGLGFKIEVTSDYSFRFNLYNGVDRSLAQEELPYVVFSPDFDNLINTDYRNSVMNMKNVAYVAGEDQGANRVIESVGESVGVDRRELFVDARDIQSKDDNGNVIPISEYRRNLTSRGVDELMSYEHEKDFEGELEDLHTFKFEEDYQLGDLVQVVNEYGIDATARVSEITRVVDAEGYRLLPTFSIIK